MYHVGLMQMLGIGGVRIEHTDGAHLIKQAADAGYGMAQSFLGLQAERGDGTLFGQVSELKLANVALRLMARTFKGRIQERVRADFDRLKALIEAT